ncbi:MAG: acetylglutamate kinase [Deltaproteobacteria bacterium]|nr:acetylglutamate kinase [Deltaproteobacteria bacterium]
MEELIRKAKILVEVLPYIRAFGDKTVVVKYGGAAMENDALKASFAKDVTLLRFIGLRPVIVHGGGPQIGRMLARLGKQSEFVDGVRVTDDETMEVVEMVLGGQINAEIVSLIGEAGGQAIGLTGKDAGGFLRVRTLLGPGGRDLGRVGTPESVDVSAIRTLTKDGFIPVIAPVGVDAAGATYNVNADTAAGAIAEALSAEKLILLTDVVGVLDEAKTLIAQMSETQVRAAIADGTVKGGMIPKLECAVHALEHGVTAAHVIDGRVPHALLLEIFTDVGVGTKLVRDAAR